MDLRHLFTWPFDNWMRPIFLGFLSLPVLIISSFIDIGLIRVIGEALFIFSFALLLLSFFFLLFKRQWSKSFYTFTFIAAVIVVFGLFSS